jgi:hypothetical protein
MRNIFSERYLILVPAAASFLRHIPQPHSSKQMTVIQLSGVQWVVNSIKIKWNMLVKFSLQEFNLKKQMYSCWEFHVDDRSESSSTYDMIMERDLLRELGIIIKLNDHTVTWDTDTIPMKDRDTALYHQ